ncbi:MAG: hypothetical protein WCK49_04250 [Myxococcaceae bacterium]
MKITEVYFRPYTSKNGQQWFELYNDGDVPVDLKKSVIKLSSGEKSWVSILPEKKFIIDPGQYVVFAQREDLGQDLCSEYFVIVLKNFKFFTGGSQNLCVKTLDKNEVCAKFKDAIQSEECEYAPELLGSPGLPSDFCEQEMLSGWHVCTEVTKKAVPAQTPNARQTLSHTLSGCQSVLSDGSFEFVGLFFALFYSLHLRRAGK